MASDAKKTLKAIPPKEVAWVRCRGPDEAEYLITSTPDRTFYSLYKNTKGGYVRLARHKTPAQFNEMIYPPERETTRKRKQDR